MELERESYRTLFDPALEILDALHNEQPKYPPHLKNSIPTTVRLHFKFLKMFFWGLDYWVESKDARHLHFVLSTMTMRRELKQIAFEFIEHYERARFFADPGEMSIREMICWEEINYVLEERIKHFKPQVKEICFLLLGGAFQPKSCQNDEDLFLEYERRETGYFIDFILENLEALNSGIDLVAPVKQQIAFIQGKLKVFGKFAYLVTDCETGVKSLGELISHTQTWAVPISCLAYMYWIEEMDESLASIMGSMLSSLMQRTIPYSPEVIALYLDVLKATRYQELEGTMISQGPQLLVTYVDFLLEYLLIPMKDDAEIFCQGLIFLLSFVMDRRKEHPEDTELSSSEDGKQILAQIDAIISEVPSFFCSIHVDEMKRGISKIKLSDFLQKIERIKAEVRELYVMTPSHINFPRTNAIGFFDFFLGNLEKMLEEDVYFIAVVKHGIQTVREELALLRHFLQNNKNRRNEQEELKDLRARTVNVVYYAAYVISLCPAATFSVWYGIIYLPCVIEEIKLIKAEVKEIKNHQMYKNKMLSDKTESSNALLLQATTSKIEGAFVGFREDTISIISHLVKGRRGRTIISISGMPGQGKTTLAKRIFNDPSIQCHFHKIVWCYISKECKKRELLITILHDVGNIDVEKSYTLEIQDLVELLRKSLKGQRYLIVMDDIWDVDLWCQVQGSFPDDKNGSRILFTSRNHNLATEVGPNTISHPLQLFSHEQSWELMKEMLFHGDDCAPEILEIGKQIGIYCKGLPLAVVLIAAVLGRTERKLESWNKVAENLKSHLDCEGCMYIIELSYEYLQDHLKPCFLYFGAFPRGESIHANKLKLLWIAEGFIKENEMHSSKDLAKEYLDSLVSQSLVVVTERSSLGVIKRCNVHDLLYDLCLEKSMKENFFQLVDMLKLRLCEAFSRVVGHDKLFIM